MFMTLLAGRLSAAAAESEGRTRAISVEDLIEVRKPSNVALSPDGRWVSYVLTTPLLESNRYLHDIYIVRADGSGTPRQLTHSEPRTGFLASRPQMSTVWSPASDRLVFVAHREGKTAVHTINIRTGEESVLVASDALAGAFDFKPEHLGYFGDSIAFSPDGRSLALLASRPQQPAVAPVLNHAIEAGEDWAASASPDTLEPIAQLFIVDLRTLKSTAVTDARLHVAAFRWSPDSRRLALEAVAEPSVPARFIKGDIYLVDAAGGEPRALVRIPGWDRNPTWSGDGKDIAFCTQRGKEDWMYGCSLAVVAADGRTPPRDLGKTLDQLSGSMLSSIHWTATSQHIDVLAGYRLSRHLFRVNARTGETTRLTQRDDRRYDEVTYSTDGKLMALRAQGAAVPPDIYVSGTRLFKPRRLTQINPGWDEKRVPSVEIVKWRSKDGRWEIPGLLLKPSGYRSGQRYPMLTAILGGPGQVDQTLNPIWNYPLLALAEQGYVILLPQSRGRPGSGVEFAHAIRDERSYVLNPLSDVLTGVDEMVSRGIADPDRLGVLGFSYGGTLTAYAVTLTNRFKAAIYGEGTPSVLEGLAYHHKTFLGLFRDMWGVSSPFEPRDLLSAFEQSALYRLDRVCTPVLLESGENSSWATDRNLYRGLRHFGVPAEFYVYPRSGHGWDEPLLMRDAYRRHIAWFDYWINDRPYSNQEKQQIYDAWQKAMRGGRQAQKPGRDLLGERPQHR
jgi:dipeptidyl aminopeptidase/acylaminoacyl peptidase